jgi:hypothetical protein
MGKLVSASLASAIWMTAGIAPAVRGDIATNSPFLPASMPSSSYVSDPSTTIELRGIMSSPDDGLTYCIYDVGKKRSVWAKQNEAGNDFVVRSADPDGDGVTVDFGGRILHLSLRSSKVASAPAFESVAAAPRASAASMGDAGVGRPDGKPAVVNARAENLRRRQEIAKIIEEAKASGAGGR